MTLRQLFDRPEKWAQKSMALDAQGKPVHYNSDKAVCWCLLGGLCKAYGPERAEELITDVRKHLGKTSVVNWNDHTDRVFEDVVKLMDSMKL